MTLSGEVETILTAAGLALNDVETWTAARPTFAPGASALSFRGAHAEESRSCSGRAIPGFLAAARNDRTEVASRKPSANQLRGSG